MYNNMRYVFFYSPIQVPCNHNFSVEMMLENMLWETEITKNNSILKSDFDAGLLHKMRLDNQLMMREPPWLILYSLMFLKFT